MRIVAGSAKGVRLGPVPAGVRPLSDRAREGLFSSLGHRVAEARVLDLFAGTGATGIEALSRGAAEAVFVDRSAAAVAAVEDNLLRAKVAERATTIRGEALATLRRDPRCAGPFDLVLLDPPYELGPPTGDELLVEVGAEGRLSVDATVVLTRGDRSSTLVVPLHWAVARELRYGDSVLTLYRRGAGGQGG
jgi:16S rRNA (guanine966-N2)-methyltransferase